MRAKLGCFIRCYLLFILALIAGCATSFEKDYVALDFRPARCGKVAILPFVNFSEYPRAGQIITDLMTTQLYAVRKFSIMQEQQVMKMLKDASFDRQKLEDPSYIQQIGKILQVDSLVVGSVSEYRYKNGLGEEPVVGINARMVRVADGTVVWAASHSRGGQYFWFSHDSLNRLAQKVCQEMVETLCH